MAKVKVINTNEHTITVHTGGPNGHSEIFKHAVQNPDDRLKYIPSETIVDSDWLDVARKSPVVSHYFKEGGLSVVESVDDSESKSSQSKQRGNK